MTTDNQSTRSHPGLAAAGLLVLLGLLSGTAQAQRPSIAALQTQITTLQSQVASGTIPNVGGYVTMDLSTPSRPVLRVAGANLQVVSGSGSTAGTVNGVGNVIIGYNETSAGALTVCSDGTFSTQPTCLSPAVWGANQHTGSHNLVIGSGHSYTSYGGLVAGNENAVNRVSASVTGGRNNNASGQYSSVSGGGTNLAQGDYSSITAGSQNKALAGFTSVHGGGSNTATAPVNGSGQFVGFGSSVGGGYNNTAGGDLTSVSGGGGVNYSANQGWAGGTYTSP